MSGNKKNHLLFVVIKFYSLIALLLFIGCNKEKFAPANTPTQMGPPIDTVNTIQLIHNANPSDVAAGLDHVDFFNWKGKDTTGRTYYLGDNWGISVPNTASWPWNIYYVEVAALLCQDSIKGKTDLYVLYAPDTAVINSASFILLDLRGDTPLKYFLSPGGLIAVYSPVFSRPADSILTANYNNYIFGLNDWYVRYWYQ